MSPALRSARQCALLPLIFILCHCRGLSPVERHFLRAPAKATGGLSGIERQTWIQSQRKDPAQRKLARRAGYLNLPSNPRRKSSALNGLEAWHQAGGGLAILCLDPLVAPAGHHLSLLKYTHHGYRDVTRSTVGASHAGAWRMDIPGQAILGYRVAGRNGSVLTLQPAVRVTWDGTRWIASAWSGASVRYQLPDSGL